MAGPNRKTKKLSPEEKKDASDYVSTTKLKETLNVNELLSKFKPRGRQNDLMKDLEKFPINIVIGSAGTGKTLSTCYHALDCITNKGFKEIILVRPIVESASKGLGFLKGELEDKLAPYQSVFIENITKLIGKVPYVKLVENERIRFEPVNFMQGKTFDDAVILVDESQNFTLDELMIITTRLGQKSKIIFTGDYFQTNFKGAEGALKQYIDMYKSVKEINTFTFTADDIQRRKLLIDIVKIWEEHKSKLPKKQ